MFNEDVRQTCSAGMSSVVLLANLEICLRMLADGADLWRLGADHDVTAVAAFPDHHAALLEHGLSLHILKQRAVALLVRLLDGRNAAELRRQRGKALLLSLARHALVHVRPLGILALGGVEQVLRRVAQLAQCLEPQLGVLFLVLRRLQEQRSDLLVAGLLGDRCKVGVLVAGLISFFPGHCSW